mmetsp:Transcript_22082/g.71082  ORF Transcript_22082/g.71082 Transcript_22082/m.71082 type:complete len:237 (-) Transcript_22082:482-1192(-)
MTRMLQMWMVWRLEAMARKRRSRKARVLQRREQTQQRQGQRQMPTAQRRPRGSWRRTTRRFSWMTWTWRSWMMKVATRQACAPPRASRVDDRCVHTDCATSTHSNTHRRHATASLGLRCCYIRGRSCLDCSDTVANRIYTPISHRLQLVLHAIAHRTSVALGLFELFVRAQRGQLGSDLGHSRIHWWLLLRRILQHRRHRSRLRWSQRQLLVRLGLLLLLVRPVVAVVHHEPHHER